MPSRERFRSGRESIVQQPEYQEKVQLAFHKGEKPCITIRDLNISRSTYYRILIALGIIIRSPLNGGNANNTNEHTTDSVQAFLNNNPVPESAGKYYKEYQIRSHQRCESSK